MQSLNYINKEWVAVYIYIWIWFIRTGGLDCDQLMFLLGP
jgi:hypothetical protein